MLLLITFLSLELVIRYLGRFLYWVAGVETLAVKNYTFDICSVHFPQIREVTVNPAYGALRRDDMALYSIPPYVIGVRYHLMNLKLLSKYFFFRNLKRLRGEAARELNSSTSLLKKMNGEGRNSKDSWPPATTHSNHIICRL